MNNLYRKVDPEQPTPWWLVPVEGPVIRVTQAGGMGAWQCNTCRQDCRADGPGCEGSDYDFTPSYWPDDNGEFWLVKIGGDDADI